MQIILVQSEVETAIRDYVANRLTLADGTDIKIDLSATRGQDGIKATIDLVEPGASEQSKHVPVLAPAPAATQKAAQAPAAQKQAAAVTQATETAAAASELPVDQSAGNTAVAADATPAAAAQQAEQALAGDTAQPEAATPATGETPTRSLFAGLARPKNS